MEFLVRLDDKVNMLAFCMNPVHKGNRMDRVVYDDPTFNAPCPDCGSTEFVYRKNNAISKKGHFITYKPDGWTWGTNERKHFGIVQINCTEAQAAAWCSDTGAVEPEDVKAMIAYRPRRFALDFEKVLTAKELKTWQNQDVDSTVKTLAVSQLSNIKAVV